MSNSVRTEAKSAPTGTTFVSAGQGGTESGGTVTWNLGSNTAGTPGAGATGGGTVSLNNASGNTTSSGTSATLSHETLAGSDRLLLVGISWRNSVIVTSVTYGGVGLTLVGTTNNGSSARMAIYRLLSPNVQTANVQVNFSGSEITPDVMNADMIALES